MTTIVATLALMTTLSSGPDAAGQAFVAGQENPRAAQTVGSSDADAIRQRVKEGQKVRITDDQGREWQGRIEELAPNHLVLLTKDRQLRDVPYAAILRIDRPHDTLANGALIGFVSGAVYGLLAVLAEENADCEPGAFFSCGDPTAAAYVVIPPVLGAVGAGIGVAIDALVRRDPTLFRRRDSRVMLAPLLGREVRGVSLSVRW
jgi:RNA methyltransferase-like protein